MHHAAAMPAELCLLSVILSIFVVQIWICTQFNSKSGKSLKATGCEIQVRLIEHGVYIFECKLFFVPGLSEEERCVTNITVQRLIIIICIVHVTVLTSDIFA